MAPRSGGFSSGGVMDAAGSDVVIQAGQVSTKVDINQHNIQLGTIAASLVGACLLLFKGGMLHLSTLSEPCAQAGSLLVHGSQWETVLFSVFVGMAMAIHYMLPKPPAFESLQNEVQSLRAQNAAHMTTIDELTASLDVSQAEQQDSAGENEEMKLKLDEAEGEMVNLEEELALSDNELCVVNAKYAERISELQEVKGDIENLLGATKIGVLYLDQDLRIRKFTEAMTDIAPWTQADIGRSAEQFSYEFTQPMVAACKQVLMQQQQDEWRQEVSHDGKNFMMRVLPHTQTSTNITGVVVTFLDVTEKVLQKRDYLRLIEHANAPIFGIDNKGLINEWNRKSAELTLYSKEDVMGRNLVEEFIIPEFKNAVRLVLERALRGEETDNFEFPLATKTGTRVEVLLNASSRRNADEEIIGVVGIGQDISGRKETETQMMRVAEELNLLIDTANAPIFGIGINGEVNEWNKKAAELTEYTKEETLGRNLVREFITPEYRKAVATVLDSALQGKVTANFEFPLFTKHGRRLELLLNANPRRDAAGEIIGVVGVGQDITDRIAQEQEYVRLIDTANAPIFGIDSNGLVNVWNNMAVTITGFSKIEVMGRNLVEEFITPDYRKSVKEVLDGALSGKESANFEFPLITKGKKRVEVLLNATSRRDGKDAIIGVVGWPGHYGEECTGAGVHAAD